MKTLSTFTRMVVSCLAASMPMLVLAANPVLRGTYQVVPGDTLDKVIRKTMPDSPLRVEILRNAFIQQNPQAFTKAPPRALVSGAVLNIPNHDDLIRSYMLPGTSGKSPTGGYSTASANERKNWVRFP